MYGIWIFTYRLRLHLMIIISISVQIEKRVEERSQTYQLHPCPCGDDVGCPLPPLRRLPLLRLQLFMSFSIDLTRLHRSCKHTSCTLSLVVASEKSSQTTLFGTSSSGTTSGTSSTSSSTETLASRKLAYELLAGKVDDLLVTLVVCGSGLSTPEKGG